MRRNRRRLPRRVFLVCRRFDGERTDALKDVDTPEIARVKAKVKIALAAAKSALSDGAAQVRSQARQVTKTTDTYVRDNPWQVVGVAALIGIAVGILATRRGD